MIKLFDSEIKVMEVLWQSGDVSARRIAEVLGEQIGWNINTTYTVIKKCIDKKAIERIEPNYICHALITREEVRGQELDELIDKLFEGSDTLLFASLLSRGKLTEEHAERLRQIVRNSTEE